MLWVQTKRQAPPIGLTPRTRVQFGVEDHCWFIKTVFFPCPSFPSRRCQWYFSAFPMERGTQGLKPELHKPISWDLLVVHERLERPKFQVAFLATTHSSFGGRTLFIWLPSAVPSFLGKICPDHQPLVYLFLLQKTI